MPVLFALGGHDLVGRTDEFRFGDARTVELKGIPGPIASIPSKSRRKSHDGDVDPRSVGAEGVEPPTFAL